MINQLIQQLPKYEQRHAANAVIHARNGNMLGIDAAILEWIAAANCEVIVDECDEDETSYTVVSKSSYTTQAERQADFQHTKRI